MEQQSGTLAQLTNQRAVVLSHDICTKHQPACDLEKQVRERSDGYRLYFMFCFLKTDIGAGGDVGGARGAASRHPQGHREQGIVVVERVLISCH